MESPVIVTMMMPAPVFSSPSWIWRRCSWTIVDGDKFPGSDYVLETDDWKPSLFGG
jgi:hypothetical protein